MNVAWTSFAISAAALAYTYFGYPGILWLLGALYRRKSVAAAGAVKAVSIVIVVRNAENLVAKKIGNLLSQQEMPEACEIIIASDGSTDGTVRAATEMAAERGVLSAECGPAFGAAARASERSVASQSSKCASHIGEETGQGRSRSRHPSVRVVEFEKHRGKAAVLNEVVPPCRGEIVVLADVRQEFAPDAIRNLCRNFSDPEIGAVSGELIFRRGSSDRAPAGAADSYWRYEKAIRKMESGLDSTCGCTGAIYAIRRSLYRPIHPDTVLDDVAIPLLILMQGKRVVFDETARAFDEPSRDFGQEKRRKIRTLAGNFQLCALYPELLNPWRNRIVFQFVSHKLMRLFCPWFLLLLLLASGLLARGEPWIAPLFLLQVLFYLLGFAGILLQHVRTPLLYVPAAFLSLNGAAILGTWHFLRGDLKGKW